MSDREQRTKTVRMPASESDLGAAVVELIAGEGAGWRRRIERATTVIGRSARADLPIDADGVSRKHAKLIATADGAHTLMDLGSRNGTLLNGRPIDVASLRDGDRIQLGTAVLRFTQATRASPSGDPHPLSSLSARERDVARWVGEGLTNAEIGARLHISPRTVGTHLANVYGRLEIPNRAALARLVAEFGLPEG